MIEETEEETEFEEEELRDPFALVNTLIEGDTPEKREVSSGRVQLVRAPNPIEFIEDPKYLGAFELKPAQYKVIVDFYELLCPMCNDIEQIASGGYAPRHKQVLFEHDECPKCGYYKYDNPDNLRMYNALTGIVGMRGGKSVLAAGMAAWEIHDILCIDKLQEKLGLVKRQPLEVAFVASTGEQASETVYGRFRDFFDESKWFQDYVTTLRNLERSDPNLRRFDLYQGEPKSPTITFNDKGIVIKSRNSNSGGMAGRTRILSVIDELARMDRGESKISAMEVHRVLNRSLITVRSKVRKLRNNGTYKVPDAKMICISSPLYEDDMMMQLKKQSVKNKKMYVFHMPTWDFNPEISQEDLAEEFEADPLGAERDYGANPPGAENPFIENKEILYAAVDDRPSCFDLKEEFFEQNIKDTVFKYVKIIIENFRFNNLVEYAIHCDPGQTRDSFGLAIGHKEGDTVILDGCIEMRPIPKGNRQGLTPREAYFPCITDIILEINKKVSLFAVSYDRWNNTEQIHRLRDNKILAVQKNLSRDDYLRYKNTLKDGNYRFPALEADLDQLGFDSMRNIPVARAVSQIKKLNDNGSKVDHPPGQHNDVAECCVGIHRLLVAPEEILNKPTIKKAIDSQRYSRKQYPKKLGSLVNFSRFR